MEWIPHRPGDLEAEDTARSIIEIARDTYLEPAVPGHIAVICAKFKSAKQASRVVECINGRYSGAYARVIEVDLLH